MKHTVDDDTAATATANRPKTGSSPRSGPSEAETKEMQKKVEAAGTPGPEHKALDVLVGDWKAEVKCWMEPDGPPHVSQGTSKASWILNGRFLEEEFRGEMMGKPFTGRTLMGYDNIKHTFNSVWISDMQTSMFISQGKGENGNKTITLEGKADCAASGQKDMPMKTTLRLVSPDKHIFEMYNGAKGENTKTMEITYTRK
ncbi:MAG: uncharacterized protein JWN25_3175 [Verrucomicrobiales bacterium]|nr:uncharacterized protein [Verrucomicrobiales bacterium]